MHRRSLLEGSCEVLGASDSTGASTAVDYTPAREEQDGLERRSPTNLTSREIVSHGGRSTGKFTGSLTTPGSTVVSVCSPLGASGGGR